MTAGERLFCDTNVLLSAVDRKRKLHAQALHVLNMLPNRGVALHVSGQIVREFLVVCTRAVDANGLGLSRPEAVRNAEAVVGRSTVLEENRTWRFACSKSPGRRGARASSFTMPTS